MLYTAVGLYILQCLQNNYPRSTMYLVNSIEIDYGKMKTALAQLMKVQAKEAK